MRRHLFTFCSVIWMLVIFIFSSLSGDQLGPDTSIVNGIKKIGHGVIFGVLAGLYLWTFKGKRTLAETNISVFALSFILTVLYAVTDEYHQTFTPGRHAAVRDVVIDAAGAIICLGTLYLIRAKGKKY